MNLRPAPKLAYSILTLACIGFFLFAATCFIWSPGFYYDEVLFAPVSYLIAGEHVRVPVGMSFLGLPVALFPIYVGALKAYLMAPILSLFGSSFLTLRLPMILVGAFCLWLLAKFLEPRLGIKAAGFALLLAATDPLFIYTTKIDWGPTTLAALFRCLAIGFLFRFFETRRSRDMALFLGACAFGLWDKSNFIWLIIALGVASLIFYREALLVWLRATPKKEIAKTIFVPTLIYLLILIGIIFRSLKTALPDHPLSAMDYIDRIGKIFQLYVKSASGQFIFDYTFNSHLVNLALAPWLVPFQTLFGLVISLPINIFKNTSYRRELGFVSLVVLLIFVQAVLTPQTWGAHHMVVFWPLTHVQLILCGLVIGAWIKQRTTPFILFRCAFFVSIFFLCATAIRADGGYLAAMRDNKAATLFRPEIADLAARLNSLAVDNIYAIDWGLGNQLMVLTKRKDRVKYQDVWSVFSDRPGEPKHRERLFEWLMSQPRAAFVSYVDDSSSGHQNHLSRDAILKSWPLCSWEKIFIPKTTGEPLYRIDLIQACPAK